jgi:hypothetical protein
LADLTFRTALTLTERAVFNAVNRALRKRLSPVADVAALRAAVTRGSGAVGYQRSDHELVYVTSQAVCYEWSTASQAADDGDLVVKPTDAGTTGRWLKTASAVQAGYLVDVRLYEGEKTEAELLDRLLGQRPSVAIRWESTENTPKSQVAGALYRSDVQFDLWAVSSNLRGGALPEAVVGSDVAAEFAADPGVNAVVGDVKQALAGKTGEELGQAGISYCEIGAEEPVYRSLAERRFVSSVKLVVHTTVHNTDEAVAPGDSVPLTEIDVSFAIETS